MTPPSSLYCLFAWLRRTPTSLVYCFFKSSYFDRCISTVSQTITMGLLRVLIDTCGESWDIKIALTIVLYLIAFLCSWAIWQAYNHLVVSPLRCIPGPKAFALSKWRLGYEEYRGVRTHCVHNLHQRYGEVVRVGPNEVSFSSLSALRKIYGSGSQFQRDDFYQMFDAYGRKVLFSYASGSEHRGMLALLVPV